MYKLYIVQVLDSTINIKDLEPTTEVRRENTTVSCHPPTEETSGQRPVVSHAASRHDTTVPDLPLYPSGSSSQALPSEPSKIPALVLPKQSKKNAKKKVTIDDINEIHLAVLQKEHIRLDLEIENLLLKKQEIMLRIQELESRSNVFSC